MQLDNPFPLEIRLLFDCWKCWECGENGQRSGGLELHHITGRTSNSAFNGAVLCKKCHEKANHNTQEEIKYTVKTLKYLLKIGYTPTQKDYQHLLDNAHLLQVGAEQFQL